MSMTVITYGGGEVLKNIFDAVAMLMNGHSHDLFRPMLIITASIGGLLAIAKAMFSGASEHLISRYFIPLLAIMGLLCIPTTDLRIEDVLHNRAYTISHVPLFLAKFTEITSSIGYRLTAGIEHAMHVPQDASYNATGMLFGSDTALDMHRLQLTDATLEHNLRRFSKQCVLYDIALGRYSVDELKKTTDLWKFLGDRTSSVRMIPYTDPTAPQKSRYLSCKEALTQMAPIFAKEKAFYAGHEIAKYLPLAFQALTGIQRDREELISQQLMMGVLAKEFSGHHLAISRADTQQRSTYMIMGALASKSLVVMRIVLEALIYASFLFIIPLALLPGGLRFLGSWMWLVVWIQLWPPFYGILNYVMQTAAHGYAHSLFHGLSASQQGLSFFTNAGIRNLHQDLFSLAGYLSASIPFLSYAILRGGMSSFIHLASSMMTPGHTAAGAAASEQSTGNYSFANASLGQTSHGNVTAHQHNLAPSLSTGYFSDHRGTSSLLYGDEQSILRQSTSELRTSLFGDASTSESAQHAYQHAQSATDQAQQSYLESLGTTSRDFADYTHHLAASTNLGESFSSREGYDLQESARYLESLSSTWGEQYGLSKRESAEIMGAAGLSAGGGLNLAVVRFGGSIESKLSGHRGTSRDDILNSALNAATSEDFQRHWQSVVGSTHSTNFASSNDEGGRLAQGLSRSIDRLEQSQYMHQAALSTLDQVSDALSSTSQHALQLRSALNQDFVDWASQTYSDQGGISKVADLLNYGSADAKSDLMQGFITQLNKRQIFPTSTGSLPLRSTVDQSLSRTLTTHPELKRTPTLNPVIATAEGQGLHEGISTSGRATQLQAWDRAGEQVHRQTQSTRSHHADQQHRLEERYSTRHKKNLLTNAPTPPDAPQALVGNYQFPEPPLWMQE